ncbi:hypothetical protein L210DRAFT_2229535 [Boletus edulis BED1]|uniref:Uncharacterized protein n=1 Tax=Boletus edulis BED1 TaxID=1328754 RepID=A0AAD4GES6_BOLED|nr:hypothetical protein L210DRAFT_2229535 [Boletus edulis BED1]
MQRSVEHEQLRHASEPVPHTLTSARALADPSNKSNVSLPPPPGLPKPSHRRRRNGAHTLMKPVNDAADDFHFERYNGPAVTSRVVICPPPSGATPHVVKLPANKDTQPVPRSPATSTSSLSEEPSGGSSVLWSDTTFTSVESNVSNQIPQNHKMPICRDWMRDRCHRPKCRFLHPERPNQFGNPATRPTQPLSPPQPVVVKTPARTCDQTNNSIPRRHDPPSGDVELQRPEPLYATTISDHIQVRFDRGFQVREVVTGFESRWVHLGNIDGTVTLERLNELLWPYGVESINLPEASPAGKPVTAKTQFASAADAIKAVTDLNGIEFAKRTITAKLAINNSIRGNAFLTDTAVQLLWECPFRVGYAGYDTLKEAKAVLDSLNGFSMEYLVVSAQLYEGLPCVGAYNIIFKQLPARVTDQDLRKFANSKAVMLGRPNYDSLDKAVKSIRSRLEQYGTITSFDILPPPYSHGMVKAWAHFTSPTEARAAQADLDRRRPKVIGHTILTCRHVVSVSHVLSAASYKKMREDIGWLRWSWQRRYGPSVSIREKVADDDAPAYVRLSSEQPKLLSSLKYEFEQLLHGETITLEKKPLWDDFLTATAGHAYIAEVQAQYPGIQIRVQHYRRVISLWGPIVVRHRARQDIVRKIMELKAQQFWRIPLSGKLLGIFCSAELCTLQGLLGPENCILDFGERVLVVRGNDRAFRTACTAVQDAQSRQGDDPSSSDAMCPVCFGEAVVPVSLACGHQWCRACLTGYLTSAVENKMFPLKCLGNDAACTECIPLGLSRKLLSASDFNAVIEAAFWVYVHSRPDEFRHCPTPDCTQVYRSAPPNAVLQCPSCLIRICPACRIKYHDGMTCEERDVAEDKLFNEWTSNNDVKSCPGCKVPIERSEGCNHMTCTRCQAHICWECLATFPRGQGIYEHMRSQHGGIGL